LPHELTKGVVFIAIDRPFEVEDMVFVRSLEGDYIAREQLIGSSPWRLQRRSGSTSSRLHCPWPS